MGFRNLKKFLLMHQININMFQNDVHSYDFNI